MAGLDWIAARPIAHRGLHDRNVGIVENTETAFAAALDAGFAIECDIQLSADGEAMVFHDYTLDRLTDENGRVADRSAAELKTIPIAGSGDRMQTLGELIEQVGDKAPLIVEIKSQWADVGTLERRAAALVAGHPGPIALMSFDPRSVAAIAAAEPWIPRGIVSGRYRDRRYWRRYGLTAWQRFRLRHMLHALSTKPHFVAYDIAGLPAIAPLVAKWLAGAPLITWTVRTPAERRRARRYADQMIFEGFRPD